MNADALLVSTKFAPPRISARSIVRRQLLEQLRAAGHSSLALITGSAGFGKTILLAQWRQELMKSGVDVAWLSLSGEERQLPNLCAYVLGALQRVGVPIDDDILPEPGGEQSMDGAIAAAIGSVAAWGRDLYLILDDYHHVADASAHKFMQRLLDHSPDNLHIAIATRTAPPLSLGRLRVRGQVVEIECASLPFDLEETRTFFDQNLATLKLGAEEVRLIHDMTSGWPASLQLIAIVLRNRPHARTTLRDLAWQSSDLQAYLAEEVMADLPPGLGQFLEQLSICRRFNFDLAASVTGNAHAIEWIERAEEENLLIYRSESDDRMPWYRFHPLFGDFLLSRLRRHGSSAMDELHRRAARWFAQNGELDDAVRHAVSGNDLDFAVQAIEQRAPETWSMAYVSQMIHLFDRLPQQTLFAHPSLFFLGCLTHALTGRPAKAEKWLAQIRESGAAHLPAVSSRLVLADATVAFQRDDSQRVIDLLEPIKRISPDDRFFYYVHLTILAPAYGAVGRHADAFRLLEEHAIAEQDRRNDMALITEYVRIASLPIIQGRVRDVARDAGGFLARIEGWFGRRCVPAILCAASVSESLYELDRLDEARAVISNRTATLRISSPDVMIRAALVRARLDLLQEGSDVALEVVESLAAHYAGMGLERLTAAMHAEAVRILLAERETVRAQRHQQSLDLLGEAHRNSQGFLAEVPIIAAQSNARMSLHDKRPADALEPLRRMEQFAERTGRTGLKALALLLQARAHDDLGRFEDADNALTQALREAAVLGLIRTFVDEGKQVKDMLSRLRGSQRLTDAEVAYLDELFKHFGQTDEPEAPVGDQSQPRGPAGKVGLTPRELEILKLVGMAMSGKRIAQTLGITPETVKWNIRNILTKLRLTSRYDALNWARKQGLIE